MSAFRRRHRPAPRLTVVGLVVLGACHHATPVASAPPPASAPKSQPTSPTAGGTIASVVTSGPTLARAIHDRYAGTAPRNITFVQKTTVSLSSGSQVVQTWYTAGELPGRWRVDTDLGSKGGNLYVVDSTYQFTAGKLAKADTGMNELLVVAFDLYAQPAARSEAMLRRFGIDVGRFHEATWRGAPVYVIGAARGDTTSKQLWVDRERLLPVRLLENTRQGRADFRFTSPVQAGGGWFPTEIEQIVNGKRRLLEQISQIHTNVALSDALFDPRRWATAPHWTP